MKLPLLAVIALLVHLSSHAFAAAVTSGDLSVEVSTTGTYTVSEKSTHWRLVGTLPGPVKDVFQDIETKTPTDAIGHYQVLRFTFTDSNRPMSGEIRLYDNNLILFSQTSVAASANPPSPFPDFRSIPQGLFSFSYQNGPFAPPVFTLENISTPWLLFDTGYNSILISPASHFVCASMAGDGKTELGSGFAPGLKNIPAGFTQQTLMFSGHGINHAWDTWGRAMTDLQGKTRPGNDADPILKYFGYWTDNGAYYYYKYDVSKGYQGTLQALVDQYGAEQIPIHYLQLDSWWYSKTFTQPDGSIGKIKNPKLPAGEWNRYGGTTEYKAHPFVFPKGMEAFHENAGLPFVTHNRWIDPASPYHARYTISGIAAVDPGFWREIATYLQTNGVIDYEQDWLNIILKYSPELSATVDQGDAFFDGMANAAKAHGLSMQYCMGTPACFLEGSKYANLTSIRVNEDRFEPRKYHNFLYTSRLASALGIWPWTDVYMSTEINNLLLSTLSAGPVGTGDAMGKENKANILKAVRADGVILKPDAPLVPIDSAYVSEAENPDAPLVAATYTDNDGIKTTYCVAISHKGAKGDAAPVDADSIGCPPASLFVYDYFAGKGEMRKRQPVIPILGGNFLPIDLKGRDCAYYIIAPLGSSGIAFLGDADKFVGTARKRIASLRDDGGKLTADVLFAANEREVTLHGYGLKPPRVAVNPGQAGQVQWNSSTGMFTVVVTPDLNAPALPVEGDAVRKVRVVFQCD